MISKYGGFFCLFSAGNSIFRGDAGSVCLLSVAGSGSLS